MPTAVVNFAVKNLAGYMLYFMQRQAKKVAEDYDCKHAQRIRADTGFYRDWLLPKIRCVEVDSSPSAAQTSITLSRSLYVCMCVRCLT